MGLQYFISYWVDKTAYMMLLQRRSCCLQYLPSAWLKHLITNAPTPHEAHHHTPKTRNTYHHTSTTAPLDMLTRCIFSFYHGGSRVYIYHWFEIHTHTCCCIYTLSVTDTRAHTPRLYTHLLTFTFKLLRIPRALSITLMSLLIILFHNSLIHTYMIHWQFYRYRLASNTC